MRTSTAAIAIMACFLAGAAAPAARADEAEGTVREMGFGKFKLAEKDLERLFNLSMKTTQYEPAEWRPEAGDEVKVAFTPTQSRGSTVLSVDKVTLVKAGPNSIAGLKSPAVVEVVETGKTGVKARIEGGKIVKFSRAKTTVTEPVGWLPAPGQKARITFRAESSKFTYNVVYVLERLEKAD